MTINRVTQRMMTNNSLDSLQSGLARLSRIQEQLTTGRVLNRPSDSPTDSTAAMRMRSSLSDQKQYARNGEDGLGWLGQIDTALSSMTDQVRRARELGLQGRGASSQTSREALATEIEQLRQSAIGVANTEYLGRPVFGGVTPGSAAYNAAGQFVGQPGEVTRRVADGVSVRVDADGPAIFGPDGSNVFDDMQRLADGLRANDEAVISAAMGAVGDGLERLTEAMADVGTRYSRIERAITVAGDSELSLTNSLAEVESTDLAEATVQLQLQEVAYQAALGATARVIQPSLLDFLR